MTNYYLEENGIITQSADWKFNKKCLKTEEDIVRDELSGQLYLKSNYDALIQTPEYIAKQATQNNSLKKIDLQSQIDELDKKRIRAIAEPSIKDEETGQNWLQYYTLQIQELRQQIQELEA